jgi:hypothetical protein
MHRRLGIAGFILLAGAARAMASDVVVCTPEFYFNSSEATPLIIPIDAARMAGSQVSWVDTQSGAYHQTMGGMDGDTVAEGQLRIVNPGSMRERIDFVAIDEKSGLLLRLSFVDENLPFVRVDSQGVASGHCVYEDEL